MRTSPTTADFARGVILVAAAQGYFLLHAEFGLIDLVGQAGLQGSLRFYMGLLAAGGLLGCLWSAVDKPEGAPFRLRSACLLAAVGAAVSPAALGPGAFLSGLGLGAWTASLAGSLTNYFSPARLGLGAGLGVGLAYAFSNLPVLFNLGGRCQAAFAAALALAGLGAVSPEAVPEAGKAPGNFGKFLPWLALFLALVWFDSAVFYLFNHLPTETGLGGLAPLSNPWAENHYSTACIHLAAAVAAGWAWDRGWGRGLLGASFAGLALAALSRSSHVPEGSAALADTLVYASAVSVYNALLVALPSSGLLTGHTPTFQAAVLYALAGWAGSAFGIGMAQDLGRVPWPVFGVLAAVVLVCVVSRRAAVAGLAVGATSLATQEISPAGPVAGRDGAHVGAETFRNEGCFHCHSQFVRPLETDLERWGPGPALEEFLAAKPPLPGNRRQGPDLTTVGARRGPAWIAGHLENLRPAGSRMASYGHLSESTRQALTSYLSGLGRDRSPARAELASTWHPAPGVSPAVSPAKLFAAHCASCHGPEGRGNGPWSASLVRPPRDLAAERFLFLPESPDRTLALARLIKFGVPGTEMPGHEWLADGEILALAVFTGQLRDSYQSLNFSPPNIHESPHR